MCSSQVRVAAQPQGEWYLVLYVQISVDIFIVILVVKTGGVLVSGSKTRFADRTEQYFRYIQWWGNRYDPRKYSCVCKTYPCYHHENYMDLGRRLYFSNIIESHVNQPEESS